MYHALLITNTLFQGDSGGPLIVAADRGGYELIGIVSWGYGCAQRDYPGVYTNIAKYKKFIVGCMHNLE